MSVLEEPVLGLNRNWQWIGMLNVRTAMTKLIGSDYDDDKVYVVDQDYVQHDFASWIKQPIDGDRFIRTPRLLIPMPEIVLVTRYGEVPKHTVKFSRVRILKRDKFTCQYCGAQPGMADLTIDHVMPVSRGGKTVWENCVASCYDCNARKADRTPSEAGIRLRRPARVPFSEMEDRVQSGDVKKIWKPFVKTR